MNPYQFFLKHAGCSYNPETETRIDGHARQARALAAAERKARDEGFYCRWEIDPYTLSADWVDNNEDGGQNCNPWQTWQCCMYNAEGGIVNSLHGIDFGRDKEPWGDPYRRVVEAELAIERLTNMPQ